MTLACLRYARTQGGKYELRLYEDVDASFSVRAFENGVLWFASVGWATRGQADMAFNQFVVNSAGEQTYLEQAVQAGR